MGDFCSRHRHYNWWDHYTAGHVSLPRIDFIHWRMGHFTRCLLYANDAGLRSYLIGSSLACGVVGSPLDVLCGPKLQPEPGSENGKTNPSACERKEGLGSYNRQVLFSLFLPADTVETCHFGNHH